MRTDRPVELTRDQRIELIKYVGNTQQDYLKRLYDRSSLIERYLVNELEVHLHFASVRDQRRACIVLNRAGDGDGDNKARVFVDVGQSPQGPHPVASIVRLQPLEQCHVFVADAFEIGGPMSLKVLWRVFNRKLYLAVRRATGISLRQLDSEVIQTTAQSISKLPNDDLDVGQDFIEKVSDMVGAIRVKLKDISATVEIEGESNLGLQLRQVLVCPPQLGLDFIETNYTCNRHRDL